MKIQLLTNYEQNMQYFMRGLDKKKYLRGIGILR